MNSIDVYFYAHKNKIHKKKAKQNMQTTPAAIRLLARKAAQLFSDTSMKLMINKFRLEISLAPKGSDGGGGDISAAAKQEYKREIVPHNVNKTTMVICSRSIRMFVCRDEYARLHHS